MNIRKAIRIVENEALASRWSAWDTLPIGTILHHGTDAEFDPEDDELIAPAWFSTSLSVATHFAKGGRIYLYEVTAPIRLPVIKSRSDRARFFELFNIDDGGAEDIADSMAQSGLPGWIIPANYRDGDDIMLVRLDSIERKGVQPAGPR